MPEKEDAMTREDCLLALQTAAERLGRLPKKGDFDDRTVMMVKSYFGPWPRALEAAGLKAPDPLREQKKREKRLAARKRRAEYRKQNPKGEQIT